ncbi:sphinganine kinase LCB3 KNAG_0C02640 [Huiozyma naganishii CBS 8797]|uniref:Phosphatidic acid phosphatase type 2/haloperoxidase domain-containing protein n=1 Tax=Huiozyma naganishii (strain ATCC MYA-139 / BCRC 22969 / CBS 8797 / KCTC 17520 / NBRC 10181 / NCYC 3082 / Yp74L-3) TaxID=1071383 RepID=J7R3G7_HUIN7|nr:hypothetical protein KNAG_0C02640 [Kazachstania naganishii CBS 8797]CCK69375.1 hypothetical protein KNAG_0C02640 [Kazachstania naganishii CBS 8797]
MTASQSEIITENDYGVAPIRVTRPRSLSDPNDLIEQNCLVDPGNHGPDHFKTKMSKWRFSIRELLVPFTDTQSAYLMRWQTRFRNPGTDILFAYTALLGSHTFYVLCLPLPAWVGFFETTRDMVYIFGYSIYLSGYLKDFLCLPRPKSPPMHRITLSSYTAKEYGAPSSHTANAIGVTLYFLFVIWFQISNDQTLTQKIVYSSIALIYAFILSMGRLYCGMHGVLDLVIGVLVGVLCFAVRMALKSYFRLFNSGKYWWYPILSIGWGLSLLLFHVRPIDECPCFDDSVAFVGVICGIECCDWFIKYFGLTMVYSFTSASARVLLARLLIGFPLLVIWKYIVGKPLCYWFVLKVLRMRDDRGERLSRLSKELRKRESQSECLLFCGVSTIDIVARFFIYGGIPMAVMLLSPAPIGWIGEKLGIQPINN